MITKTLKSLRAKVDLTQEEMAVKLGVSPSTYNRKELGQRPFTLDEAFECAKLFEKSIEEIFFKE